MNKNQKTILIIVAIIAILAIIGGIVWWTGGTNTENKMLDGSTSKVSKLYDELEKKQAYSFTTKSDDNEEVYYVTKDNQSYIRLSSQGEKIEELVIKDGNTYLLIEDEKKYYTYENNEMDLKMILLQLEEAKEKQYVEGKEKVDGKEYKYEEYEQTAGFLIKAISTEDEEKAKTRFYFDGNKLVYIKTIIGEEQETLKVDISNKVDEKLFEIPSEYQAV